MDRAWIYVILTSLFELVWIFGFNVASAWWHWIIIIPIIFLDFMFLSKACEKLPTGTVYAIFAAAGTVGTALMDIFIFDRDFSFAKGFFIIVIVAGVIALKLADNNTTDEQTEMRTE
ncbi:DMT family transporter [Virgibacillus sp. W0181]|uniref:DMT family transporter n=1 Tax=Virgibacillus sp. W0181 TaxID=3391581 RepID=UPI003F47B147